MNSLLHIETSAFANKTLLITGCNGFLGRRLLEVLVTLMDQLSKYTQPNQQSLQTKLLEGFADAFTVGFSMQQPKSIVNIEPVKDALTFTLQHHIQFPRQLNLNKIKGLVLFYY